MKLFDFSPDTISRLKKMSPQMIAFAGLALLMVIAAFLPFAFKNDSAEYGFLSVGERASVFASWNSGSSSITSTLIEKPKTTLQNDSASAVNEALSYVFGSSGSAYTPIGTEYFELSSSDGGMRVCHTYGTVSGRYRGSYDITVDSDTGRVLSISVGAVGSGREFPRDLDSDIIISWIEVHNDFVCFTSAPDEDNMGGEASFEYNGSIISISYSCAFDSNGYIGLSVCCV